MEPIKDEHVIQEEQIKDENVRVREKRKNGKSPIILTSVISSTVAALITSSVFWFAADYHKTNDSSDVNTQQTTTKSNINVTPTSASSHYNSTADMVENASKAIVGVVNYQQASTQDFFGGFGIPQTSQNGGTVETGTGSGVIWKKENGKAYIITNNHVIEGATKVEISLYDGKKTTAKVVGADALTDLAVLSIDASDVSQTLTFGDSNSIRPGDSVLAIGNPLGLDFSRSVTQGIVSATNRSMTVNTSDGEWEVNVIQTDAAINPGNSGGALINSNGEVIGINSMKISESGVEGLGFAIPSNDVIPIVKELINNGKITRPHLGVSLANVSEIPQEYLPIIPKAAQSGVIVTDIENNSAADKAGFKQQDIIVAVNGKQISTATELRKQLYSNKIGDKVAFTIYRGAAKQTLTATLQK